MYTHLWPRLQFAPDEWEEVDATPVSVNSSLLLEHSQTLCQNHAGLCPCDASICLSVYLSIYRDIDIWIYIDI